MVHPAIAQELAEATYRDRLESAARARLVRAVREQRKTASPIGDTTTRRARFRRTIAALLSA
jgi:hypothetical protein